MGYSLPPVSTTISNSHFVCSTGETTLPALVIMTGTGEPVIDDRRLWREP